MPELGFAIACLRIQIFTQNKKATIIEFLRRKIAICNEIKLNILNAKRKMYS